MLDVPIYGRVSVMELFRPPVRARASPNAACAAGALSACCARQGEATDLLFILTERYKFCVLEYNAATGAPQLRRAARCRHRLTRHAL